MHRKLPTLPAQMAGCSSVTFRQYGDPFRAALVAIVFFCCWYSLRCKGNIAKMCRGNFAVLLQLI